MASTTQGIGLGTYDLSADNTADFINGMSRNMEILDTEVTNKLKLNNESIQNVNFIRNEVVKNGLITGQIDTSLSFSVVSSFIHDGVSPILTIGNSSLGGMQIAVSSGTIRFRVSNGSAYINLFDTKIPAISNQKIEMIIIKIGNNAYVNLNGSYSNIDISTMLNTTAKPSGLVAETALYYNRPLTPQEIQHNFNVLNNSPSISHINDYVIASDTDHVTDSGSILQSRINRVFYKNMCKEFTSNGEAITVNNGMDGYVLSATLQGQTVKNLDATVNTAVWSSTSLTKSGNKITRSASTALDGSAYLRNGNNIWDSIKPNTTYTIALDLDSNLSEFYLGVYCPSEEIFAQTSRKFKKGFNAIEVTTKNFSGVSATEFRWHFYIYGSSSINSNCPLVNVGDYIELKSISIIEGTYANKLSSTIPFGLSSTQAIVYNNNLKYSFYMPTIDGKTRIMKATKGTQNWVEIDASEARDTAKYDYKLESINGDLGSVPSAYDYIDRARKVKVFNTKKAMLYDTNIVYTTEKTNTVTYTITSLVDRKYSGELIANGHICNILKSQNTSGLDEEGSFGLSGNYNLAITILKNRIPNWSDSDTVTDKVSKLNTYLKSVNAIVRYQLATPIEIPLTDAEIKAYDAYRKVIDLGGMEGARNTWELKEDGSATYTQNTIKRFLNGSETYDTNNTTYVRTNTVRFDLSMGDVKPNGSSKIISDKLQNKNISIDEKLIDVHNVTSKILISVLKTDIGYTDGDTPTIIASKFKTWLQSNPIVIEYPLLTPVVTTIDKSLVPAILTQATNTFQFGEAVAPYSATIKAPTTDDIAKYYPVTLLNNYTQTVGTATPVVDLLKDGKVRLQMDLTAPTTGMNATLFAVAPELRPVTNQRIPIFVNGVCVLGTVDKTTGNVNLASVPSASANIYIKTDYRRDI